VDHLPDQGIRRTALHDSVIGASPQSRQASRQVQSMNGRAGHWLSAPLAFSAEPLLPLGGGWRSVFAFAFLSLRRRCAGFLPVSGMPSSTIENCSLRSWPGCDPDHLHTIAGAEASTPALAYDFVGVFAPGVAVVAQRVDGTRPRQTGRSARRTGRICGIEHQSGKLLANSILHEANFLPLTNSRSARRRGAR